MFFTDGQDASAAGRTDFLANFGSGDVAPTSLDTTPEPDSQDSASLTDASTPEPTDDGQEFSAADFVADWTAASLAEDGIEIDPEPDEDETPEEGAVDFENLTPEQIRAALKEFEDIKAERAKSDSAAQLAAVQAKATEAEEAALEAVEREFETKVLNKSKEHYHAELTKRFSAIVRDAKNQDNPDGYIIQNAFAAAVRVLSDKQEYEDEQARDWKAIADQARLEARQNAPEVREFVARNVAAKYNLPDAVLADIADPTRHVLAFEKRAKELADIAASLGAASKKSRTQRQQDANQELQRNPVRTSSTGKLPRGKPRDMRTLSDQERREVGAEILQGFRSN